MPFPNEVDPQIYKNIDPELSLGPCPKAKGYKMHPKMYNYCPRIFIASYNIEYDHTNRSSWCQTTIQI